MNDDLEAARLTDRVAGLVEAARKAGADEADAVAVRGRSTSVSVRLGKVESTEFVRRRRRVAAGFRRQARGQRVGECRIGPPDAGRARGSHGEGVSRRSLPGPGRSGSAGQDDPRTRPLRPDRRDGGRTQGKRACRGRGRSGSSRREELERRRGQRRPCRTGACDLARLRRPLCRLAIRALGERHCGEGVAMERDYEYSSRLHFAELEAAERSDARRANVRCAASMRARPRPGRSPSSSSRASPAALRAIWRAPSTAPRWRGKPASCAT